MLPAPITAFFVAQVAALALLGVIATASAGRRLGEPRTRTLRWTVATAAGVALFLAGTAALAASGWLADFEAVPPRPLLLVGPVSLATIALACSPFGTRLLAGIGLAWLVGYQAFRIAVEIFLFLAHRAGEIPVQMTFEGYNFDVLSGLGALPIAALAARGRLPRWALVLWNLLGLALLVTIVTIAILSFPTPFRVFGDPPLRIVAHAPFVWLPTFLVQAALFGHVLVFRWLARNPAR